MNLLIKQQIDNLLKTYKVTADGVSFTDTPDGVSCFKFSTLQTEKQRVRVTFATYFVTGFPGFDFHDKFNHGVAPPATTMYGEITKETEKMYYFKLKSETGDSTWEGYCPKKSCTVQML